MKNSKYKFVHFMILLHIGEHLASFMLTEDVYTFSVKTCLCGYGWMEWQASLAAHSFTDTTVWPAASP